MTALAQHCFLVLALSCSRWKLCEACGRKVPTNDRHKRCQCCRKAGGYGKKRND